MTHDSSPSARWRAWAFVAMVGAVALATCRGPQALGNLQAEKASKERYAKAKALFEERCKTAGVVIHRTVTDVEGIELTKVRQPVPWGGREYFDPMWTEAAMGGEVRGDDYLKQFLMSEYLQHQAPGARGQLGPPSSEMAQQSAGTRKGYGFVEYVDTSDKQRYRCTPVWWPPRPNWVQGQHSCEPIIHSGTRYALDYEDIVDPVDRQHWIAGTTLKVIDKQSGEVMATLTKFVWDPGFGVSTTGRWPWQHADGRSDRNCPRTSLMPTGKNSRYFVDTVLNPKQGD